MYTQETTVKKESQRETKERGCSNIETKTERKRKKEREE
jgi:hypothetical protein